VIASVTLAGPQTLSEFREDLSSDIIRIVDKAVAKELNGRYQTAGELARDLRSLVARQPHWAKWGASSAPEKPQDDDPGTRVGKTAADLGGKAKKGGAKGDRITASSLFEDLKRSFKSLMEGAARRKRGHVEPIKLIREGSFLEDQDNLIKEYGGRILAASLAILGIIVAIYIAGRYLNFTSNTEKPRGLLVTRITANGKVREAAVSLSGEKLVFAFDETRQQSLILKELNNGKETKIGTLPEREYRALTFSPDGGKISYIKAEPNDTFGILYQKAVGGGAEEELIKDVKTGAVCYSPDSKNVAYLSAGANRSETSLNIKSPDGTVVVLSRRKSPSFFYPSGLAWSPDGRAIACVVKDEESGLFLKIVTVEVDGGGESTIASGRWSEIGQIAWLVNGSGLVVAAKGPTSRSSQLWRVK